MVPLMDRAEIQAKLEAHYSDWKVGLRFSSDESKSLSPPLLLCVTEDYCKAKQRVLFFGQETLRVGLGY